MSRSRLLPGLAASAVLLLTATAGHAVICTVLNSPKRFVGDTGAPGNQCTDNDIQSAIDAIKNGANTCPATIYITHDHTYTSQHLAFDNTNRIITLAGLGDGVPCGSTNPQICDPSLGCPPPPTVPLNTIDGSGTVGSVIHLNGTNRVTLRYLTIKGGAAVYDQNGGGIYFSGSGALTLDTTTVSSNYAGYGAGIYFNGEGTSTLTLLANTLVSNNTAQFSGGAIRIEGNASLLAEQPGTLIAVNKALGHDPISDTDTEGYGGGIELIGPARADLGSPGFYGFFIFDNRARYGGGIAVFGGHVPGEQQSGFVNLYTTDRAYPVSLNGNFATAAGGALYAKGTNDFDAGAYDSPVICASNFRIVDNDAPDGAIAYLDSDVNEGVAAVGSYLDMNTSHCSGPPGLQCTSDQPCDHANEARNNLSANGVGDPTGGSAIVVTTNSAVYADRIDLRGSDGDHVINIITPGVSTLGGRVTLSACLIADNAANQDLIRNASAENYLSIDSCTIAGNSIGAAQVMTGADKLVNSLIFQPGVASGPADEATYDLANDISQLPASATVKSLADPKFVDAVNGDYHLLLTSDAVDYGGGFGGTDLDGYPRDVDLPTNANTFGPRDAGAYERQSPFACDNAPDAVYCSTFDP